MHTGSRQCTESEEAEGSDAMARRKMGEKELLVIGCKGPDAHVRYDTQEGVQLILSLLFLCIS